MTVVKCAIGLTATDIVKNNLKTAIAGFFYIAENTYKILCMGHIDPWIYSYICLFTCIVYPELMVRNCCVLLGLTSLSDYLSMVSWMEVF